MSAGNVSARAGTATAFGMLVSDQLGIPLGKIIYVQSDTALVPRGGGTGGSRSLQLGGTAVVAAADEVREQARWHAATLLEASVDDVVLTDDGAFGVAGVPSTSVTWTMVVAAAEQAGEELWAGLDAAQDGSSAALSTGSNSSGPNSRQCAAGAGSRGAAAGGF